MELVLEHLIYLNLKLESMANELFSLAGILICVVCCGALVSVDWSLVLTGEASQVQVENFGESGKELPADLLVLNESSIYWGDLDPGSTSYQGLLLTNTGSSSCQLFMRAINFTPVVAEQFMNVSWNQESSYLDPGKSLEAELALHVFPGIENVTTFQIRIEIQAFWDDL